MAEVSLFGNSPSVEGVNSEEIPEWVFCNQEGGRLDTNISATRALHRCLEEAKLRQIRLHDLRHTFASLLIQNGESLAYVREQMGHSSIKVTVDIYGHLVPRANRQAVNRLPVAELRTENHFGCYSFKGN
jgi:integrase